jgi:hypothetical protein
MTIELAALELDAHLRRFPWFVSTGVGRTKEGETLFVYVKSLKHSELNSILPGWKGYRVLVRKVGSVSAVECESFVH